MVQVAIDLAVLTGVRRGDLLALTKDQLKDEGVQASRRYGVARWSQRSRRGARPITFNELRSKSASDTAELAEASARIDVGAPGEIRTPDPRLRRLSGVCTLVLDLPRHSALATWEMTRRNIA
jgi:hypothetical protein